MSTKKKIIIASSAVLLFVIIGLSAWIYMFLKNRNEKNSNNQQQNNSSQNTQVAADIRKPFANIQIDQTQVTPALEKYSIKSDLSNVTDVKRYDFSNDLKGKLSTNYFVAIDSKDEEFFPMYEENRYNYIPNFITTDSALHTYHLMFDDTLKSLEQGVFSQKMIDVTKVMLDESLKQYNYYKQANNDDFTKASARNVAYFAVADSLLGQKTPTLPADVQTIVDKELKNIKDANQIIESPLLTANIETKDLTELPKEDYTQYIVRGHYTKTVALQNYFKAMMWYGRITFLQSIRSHNLSALLINQALQNNQSALKDWANIYDTTSFLVGSSDDLGIYEYSKVQKDVYGENATTEKLVQSDLLNKYLADINKLSPPQINSIPIFNEATSPDREKVIKGFRFMGQRYTLDADVFQRLIYREVKANPDGQNRMLPKSLDIIAAMGSKDAYDLLKSQGDNKYQSYEANMTKLQTRIKSYDEKTWTQNIYWSWLYTIKPLSLTVSDGYPGFMTNQAWSYKDLNSYQGSWTELKHDTILYAKQVYSELGAAAGATAIAPDTRGYVEPRADLYARLEALTKETIEGLDNRKLFDSEYSYNEKVDCPQYSGLTNCSALYTFKGKDLRDNLVSLQKVATSLKEISVKELKNQAISDEEYKFIDEYGGELEHLWYASFHTTADKNETLNKNPLMLVADVATDPNGSVLEEGTGNVMQMYVIIPVSGGTKNYYRIARGPIWSQYEFTTPIANRVTDEKWQTDVRANKLPEIASWKKEYFVPNSSVKFKSVAMSYQSEIADQAITLNQAQQECTSGGGTFEKCGSVCSSANPNCTDKCEPLCRYY